MTSLPSYDRLLTAFTHVLLDFDVQPLHLFSVFYLRFFDKMKVPSHLFSLFLFFIIVLSFLLVHIIFVRLYLMG